MELKKMLEQISPSVFSRIGKMGSQLQSGAPESQGAGALPCCISGKLHCQSLHQQGHLKASFLILRQVTLLWNSQNRESKRSQGGENRWKTRVLSDLCKR